MEHNLRIIKGTTPTTITEKDVEFISAFATNSRLKGAMSISQCIRLKNYGVKIHQYFYADVDENGIESYDKIYDSEKEEMELLEASYIRGLGGEKISLTQKEFIYLFNKFAKRTMFLGGELPDPINEYEYLIDKKLMDDDGYNHTIMQKICVPPRTAEQLCNFFLVRYFEKDNNAVRFLTDDYSTLIHEKDASLLHKNSIEVFTKGKKNSYVCESLLEDDDGFYIKVTEIVAEKNKNYYYITEFHDISEMDITDMEASFMLKRSEYVSVFKVSDFDKFSNEFITGSINYSCKSYDSGLLFLQFAPDNSHFNSQNYALTDDVKVMYFLSNSGQFIVVAYDELTIRNAENKLQASPLQKWLTVEDRFEFKEPILYTFIVSELEDFLEFVEMLGD